MVWEVGQFDCFLFLILISSVSILVCRFFEFSLLFVVSLVLARLYLKVMNWNKDGLFGFYICCVMVLWRRNLIWLGAHWCNLCST